MAGIAVIGTGAWGTTLAIIAARQVEELGASGDVMLWDHRAERAAEMERARENALFLPGVGFPSRLRVTATLAQAVASRDVVLFVTPSQTVRENAHALAPHLMPGAAVVCASKGIELGTHQRLTQVIADVLGDGISVAALSGPNLAAEIVHGKPAASVIAAANSDVAERARAALATPLFRIYTSTDVVGVELGGALKNIIALAVGIIDGLGYGDNAKAAIMTRGLAEIARLALAAGADPLTLAGLAGLGDLIATCSSPLSRNRTLGLELAKGRSLDDVLAERRSVAEGVTTTRAALEMARELRVDLPITEQLSKVLFEGKDVQRVVSDLMERDPKNELEGLRGEE
ncbi:MAG TPA: NAD(P)H-dependent glycerol-3-phosphate dehydrogenase [Ktedonobacterales bacterium]